MSSGDYIAIDWGTTNRRIFVIRADGSVVRSSRDDRGVLAISTGAYPAEIAALRSAHGELPIVAAGMIGSTRGWRDVPYCGVPADATSLAAGAQQGGEGVWIIPGVAQRDVANADVMRGEEVQVLGAISAGLAPANALFCQPGTHNKWIETRDGRITAFTTAMTGELFSLLRRYSVLSEMLGGMVEDGPAFRDGLERGSADASLPTALFQARAAALLGVRKTEETASYVSGLLIGADVGSRSDLAERETVLLASGSLAGLYHTAIELAGGRVLPCDSSNAFTAGIHQIWKALP